MRLKRRNNYYGREDYSDLSFKLPNNNIVTRVLLRSYRIPT